MIEQLALDKAAQVEMQARVEKAGVTTSVVLASNYERMIATIDSEITRLGMETQRLKMLRADTSKKVKTAAAQLIEKLKAIYLDQTTLISSS